MIELGIALLIFLGLFLVINNLDIKKIISKRKRLNKGKVKIEHNSAGAFLEYIEKLIQKSNVRVYIPYSVSIHLVLCVVVFILGFLYMNRFLNIFVSVIFGIGLSTIPFLILRIIADILTYKVKRNSVDFLLILKNFFIASKDKDIFECFERTEKYIQEPLKSFVDILVYEHKNKINPVQCLENFRNKIEVSELKIFIENLKICYIHGGDTVGLIDAFIEEISEQNDDEDEEDTEDTMLNMGLYILLLINFVVMYFLINSNYRYSILEPMWDQIVFALDIIISIYIVIQSMNRL